MKRRPAAGLLVGALGLLTVTCGGDQATTLSTPAVTTTPAIVTTPAAATTPTTASGSAAVVPVLLDFEALLVGGGTIRGADLAGQDTLFWFWAPL